MSVVTDCNHPDWEVVDIDGVLKSELVCMKCKTSLENIVKEIKRLERKER